MVRKMREPKYHCQYCERPLDNSTTKTSHELACPKNPKNIKIEGEKIVSGQLANVPGNESKGTKKAPSKEETIQRELQKEDELLRKYPTIANLVRDVEGLKLIPEAVQTIQNQTQTQITQLGDTVGKLNVLMTGIANRMNNPPPVQTGNQEKVQISQDNSKADESLTESLAADKEKIGQTPGEKEIAPGSKMEQLKREEEKKKLLASGQVETGGVDPSLAGVVNPNIPEGLQKIIPYIELADKLGFLNKLKGTQPESAQTPGDLQIIQRVYANMSDVFNGALKLTQGFRVDARKEVMEEIMSSYKLTPKTPTTKEEAG